MRRGLVLLALLTAAACTPAPIRNELTVAFGREGNTVTLTSETRFELRPRGTAVQKRVENARSAALSNTDEWAYRFARLEPMEEEVTFRREAGALESVRRSATIRAEDLQDFFTDMNVTVSLIRRDGVSELAFFPGTSGRATRELRQRFDRDLHDWSGAVARYFLAVDHLYSYMSEAPHRADVLFAALVEADSAEGTAALLEDEAPLVDAVLAAMQDLAERIDEQNTRASTLAEETDLVLNPFPARVVVRLPGDPLAIQGFTLGRDGNPTIEPVDLVAGIVKLEGEWISPDPLAAILRDQIPSAKELAAMPRRSSPVISASEIANAIRESTTVAPQYSVSWRH